MRDYELVVLLPADGKQDSILEGVKKTIDQNKGKVGKILKWGLKPLAYPIAKQKEALYFLLNVSLPSDGPLGIDRMLRVNESILRYLLMRKVKEPTANGLQTKAGKVVEVGEKVIKSSSRSTISRKRTKGVKAKKT